MAEPIRLAKRVAAQVPCSRREAEQLVEGGFVRVDGVVVDAPESRVADHQLVTVEANAAPAAAAPATLLLHRPPGVSAEQARALLDPAHHWAGDPDRAPLRRQHLRGSAELLPLPPAASGLSVYSQDRRILRKLGDEGALVEQELLADVDGSAGPEVLARLAQGLVHEGRRLPAGKVSWQSEQRLRLAFKGLDPALVSWLCAQAGLQLRQLRRLRLGRLPMAGLPAGQWRWLQAHERF